MRIGVDIDEVIADSAAVYVPFMNRLFGRDRKKEDLFSYAFEETFDLTEDQMKEFWRSFAREGCWARIPPVEGAAETLARLRAAHEIVLVTGRPGEHLEEETRAWLAEHRMPHDALVFMGEDDKDAAVRRVLGDSPAGRGLDALVDDHWGFAEAAAGRGVRVFLVNAPWNRTAPEHPMVRRVRDLREAAGIILGDGADGAAPERPPDGRAA